MLRLQRNSGCGIVRTEVNGMREQIEEIASCPLFQGIQKDDLPPMMKCLGYHTASYKKGDYISLEEEDIKNIGIILRGKVDMVKEDLWGNKTILVRMKVGELFGETFACASSSISMASFCAASDADILFIPFKRVMRTCARTCGFHHRLIENMVTLIADKNRELIQKVEVISKRTLREKILAYLSVQAQVQGTKYFEVPLGRLEMADYLCADRSALTRELSNMRKEGLLDYDKNVFRIC